MLNALTERRTLTYMFAALVFSWATMIAASAGDAGKNERKLAPAEQAIANWVDANAADLEALIEAQVNINSGTMNPAGVNAVAEVLGEELASLGFTTERIRLPATMKRGDHLFARRGVSSAPEGKRLLLIGHLDTIFEPGDSFKRYTRQGDWASGPGISDMKAGNAIIIYALKALASVNALDGGQFVVAYTGDEESPGDPLAETRKSLIDAGKWADVSLGFESGIRDEQGEWATISRRSSSDWCLKVSGRQAHSSGIFSEAAGAGAVFEASRILSSFYDEVRGEQYLTFNAGTIMGGTEVQGDCEASTGTVFGKTNVIPRTVIVRGGLRTISNEQLARAQSAMRAVVEKSLPHTNASIEFYQGYPAMAPSEGNTMLQGMLSDINMALGGQPMLTLDPSRRGAADISFVAPHSDGLAGMGGYGTGEHSPKEQLDLRSLPMATKRAAILLYRLTR